MKSLKYILMIAASILITIQLPFFTPKKNVSKQKNQIDITDKYDVPMNIQMDLYNGCYDCHSNNTKKYPWYYHIQPISWWMNHHILEAKEQINFSEFGAYTNDEAIEKFKKLQKSMEEKSMPLKSYLWMHEESKYSEKQYQRVAEWASSMQDKLGKPTH